MKTLPLIASLAALLATQALADSPWLNLEPQAIYWPTRMCHELYGHRPILITENGCGYDNEAPVGGEGIDLLAVFGRKNRAGSV